ncbi:MAG: DUF1080 domain-containing protein [Planctomycetales bacterium]|nr:DUF1080 domain-containing protein [Planctomycetales bacterium]
MRRATFFVFCLCFLRPFSAETIAQETILNPASDPDYQVQGEYTGTHNSMLVIAAGDGEFDIVVYESPITRRSRSGNPPRRLDGDKDTVADLAKSLEVTRVVRESPTLGAAAPQGAVVLFDGSEKSLANWKDGKRSDDGLLIQGTETIQTFRDYTLHLEFRTPWMPQAGGQARGNSGVYHQGRYETQILDSFGLAGADNETGGIYEIKAPDVNACLPPMQWQTYDVDFTAARYQGDKKVSDARMTVRLNGVTVQNDVAVPRATRASKYGEGPDDGPIYLQDHGNPVRFRNIWLVPRDAQREASRPIVPGFERFFAAVDDSQGLGGEVLISTLGCVSCHAGAEGFLPVKKGPNLSNVRQRVRPDALVEMIADPHKTKRGTTMPDPWMGLNAQQRRTAAESIASHLLLSGEPVDLVDRPSRSSGINRGKQLYHSVGCVACHESFDGEQTPAATTVPLGEIESKYTVDSLAKFLTDPHAVRSGGRMPALVGSVGDAYAIAGYLTRKVTRRENEGKFRRRIYKGQWQKLPDFDELTPESDEMVSDIAIKAKSDPKHTGMVFEATIEIATAGKYEFKISSDDGSRLIVGSHTIDNDGIHPNVTKSGTFELEKGIYPVRYEWFNFEGGAELDVRVIDPLLGEMKLREMISDGKPASEPLLAGRFVPSAHAVERGAKLFQSAGCVSCHAFQSTESARQDDSAIPDLVDVRPDKGCLANSVSRPAVDFHLSPRQKSSIETAISLRKEQRSTAQQIDDETLVHATLAGLNCYACHRRGDNGGPEVARDAIFQTKIAEMGWEGRLPPPLDGVGDKLKASYLSEAVASGVKERSYMLTRMPGFGSGNLDLLHQSLTRLDSATNVDDQTATDHQPSKSDLNDGRKLVGASGLSCIKCHTYNNINAGGLGAIDLLSMPKRLRADWFGRYLQDPTKYRPGTRMPNSFPEGKSSYTKLYDGDPNHQIDSMWHYLIAGTTVKEPPGLRAGSILLTPTDRPRIYRNFFEGVSGRGIAVGYPDEVNLIWDAERMGLNSVWKSEFIDASRHWTGRGQGRTSPAGASVVGLEPWTPLAEGDSIDMTWPTESGRELGYRFGGYRLDANGNPSFQYKTKHADVHDSIVPLGNSGFERTLTVSKSSVSDPIGLVWRIAKSDVIEGSAGVYKVGSLRITIENAECQIVTVDGQSELRAQLPGDQSVTVKQTIQW